jgi:NADPH-dependent F420 reductase
MLPQAAVSGTDNLSAARQAEVVVLSVPYEAQEATLAAVKEALAGKLLITVVAPTGEKKSRVRRLPSGLSAAEEAQQQVGEDVRVVAAFQNVSAPHLTDLDFNLDYDVLVCGEKAADKAVVLQLCTDAGMRGVNAGALQNASVAEGLTAVLIAVNVIHKVRNAGIRITGL